MTATTIKDELNQLLERLTPEKQREVLEFARRAVRPAEPPRYLDVHRLRGALAHLKGQYRTGVELQHDILREWEETD